jgi:dihydrofolate reductase
VVVTGGATPEGCVSAPDLDAALRLPEVAAAEEVMVIGGERLFAEALPRLDELVLTRVHARPEGDTFFRFDPAGWRLISSEHHPADERNPLPTTWETWRREP